MKNEKEQTNNNFIMVVPIVSKIYVYVIVDVILRYF